MWRNLWTTITSAWHWLANVPNRMMDAFIVHLRRSDIGKDPHTIGLWIDGYRSDVQHITTVAREGLPHIQILSLPEAAAKDLLGRRMWGREISAETERTQMELIIVGKLFWKNNSYTLRLNFYHPNGRPCERGSVTVATKVFRSEEFLTRVDLGRKLADEIVAAIFFTTFYSTSATMKLYTDD